MAPHSSPAVRRIARAWFGTNALAHHHRDQSRPSTSSFCRILNPIMAAAPTIVNAADALDTHHQCGLDDDVKVEISQKEYATETDANAIIDFTPEESKRVRRKIDIILLPVLCFLNLCSFLDKANIGNANTAGMSKDLGLSTKEYNFLLTIFYVIYTCCQFEFLILK